MISRRNIFKKLLATAALVSLAPKIAFGELEKIATNKINPLWQEAEYKVGFMFDAKAFHNYEMKVIETYRYENMFHNFVQQSVETRTKI